MNIYLAMNVVIICAAVKGAQDDKTNARAFIVR